MLKREETRRALYYGWFIVAATFFVSLVTIGTRASFGVFINPMSQEFDWSRATISLAAAVGWLVNGASQPFAGRLYDRVGGRRVILVSLLVLGLALMALSGTSNIFFLVLVYGLVASVAMSGVSLTTLNTLLSRWFRRRRGLALGLSGTGASVGQLLIVPFAMYLLFVAGWRLTWFVLGLMVLALVVPLVWLVLRDDPREMGLLPDGDSEVPSKGGTATAAPGRSPLEVEYWAHAFRSLPMWQLAGGFFFCGFTTAIVSTHFVPFALERGFAPSVAAAAFGVMGGLNIVGVVLVGAVSDKIGRKNLLGLVYAVRALAYLVLVLFHTPWALFAFVALAGLSWFATVPLTTALTGEVYGLKNMGTLTGITFFSHQLGGAISIYFGGFMHDLVGTYDVPFAIAGSLLLLAILASFTIGERRYSSKYQTTHTMAGGPGY